MASFHADPRDPRIAPFLARAGVTTGKSVTVREATTHAIVDPRWEGGSRTLTAVRSDSLETPVSDGVVTFHPGVFAVTHGTFRGKAAHVTLYVSPGAYAGILALADDHPAPELTAVQISVLVAISQYNSRGRADFRSRYNITKPEWDAVVVELFAQGYTRKNGAITPEGRNVADAAKR